MSPIASAVRGCVLMVNVPLGRERDGGVASERLEVADGLAALGEQAKARVPEGVEPGWWQTRPLKQRLELPVDGVLGVKRSVFAGREDEP